MEDKFFNKVVDRIITEVVEEIEKKGFHPLTEREQDIIGEAASAAVVAFIKATGDAEEEAPPRKGVN